MVNELCSYTEKGKQKDQMRSYCVTSGCLLFFNLLSHSGDMPIKWASFCEEALFDMIG